MFARTSTWSGSPEALQKWADHAVGTVKGFVQALPGNAGVVFLIDRDGGTALTMTLWDSEDAAKATRIASRPGHSRRARRSSCGASPRTSPKGCGWACYAKPATRTIRPTDQVWSCSPQTSDLPIEISALAVRLRQLPPAEAAMPRLQVRTGNGRWAVLHASWMSSGGEKAIAVILQEAAPAEVAPLIMAAYGLTDREMTISALVCQGMSTRQIAGRLN